LGGSARAIEVNRSIVGLVDVLFGNEEDFSVALGFPVEGVDEQLTALDPRSFKGMMGRVTEAFPNVKLIATTLRAATSATRNDWSAVCWSAGAFHEARRYEDLEIYDRVGGGDSFASGFIYGLLESRGPQWALDCGAAHGALAMTTPGDTSMVTRGEVERVMKGGAARVSR
jgi:2-dehydro-3-deoxygluconokinase